LELAHDRLELLLRAGGYLESHYPVKEPLGPDGVSDLQREYLFRRTAILRFFLGDDTFSFFEGLFRNPG